MRTAVAGFALLLVGTVLLLSRVRWFARQPLAERLRPYLPGGFDRAPTRSLLSFSSFAEVGGPLATSVGSVASRLLGVSSDLDTRLRRAHLDQDVATFRLRQLASTLATLGASALLAVAVQVPTPVAVLVVVGAPALAFLVVEQRVTSAANSWQRRIFLELPVVSEQLGMLLSAGYSLGAALNRTSTRSDGACGRDLTAVCRRIRQGLSEVDALQEWADLADVDALRRLVQVLSLNREAADLGRLISAEARTTRRDVQRELVESIERRAQQVWIPVTVATLLPGVIFLAVPFLEAMRLFGTT